MGKTFLGKCVNGLGGSGHTLAFPTANSIMQPRIYTYKVTFEEIPDWYWGVHKEKKYGEPYLGSPKTHAWKWEFYTPILEILALFPYTDEGWIEAQNVENRCIKPDLNNPLCLNEHYGGIISLEILRKTGKKLNETIHAEKDEFGRSVQGVKNGEKFNKEKTETGKSINAIKGGKAGGHKGGKAGSLTTNSQNWVCLVTGKIAPSGPLTNWQRKRGINTALRSKVI